jgi:hypothetical protein
MFLSDENSGDRCLITEDDLSLEYVPHWGQKHWDVYNGVGDMGCDILQLGCLGEYSNPELEPIERQKQFSTVAYIINRATAKRIVTATGTGAGMNLNHLTSACADHIIYDYGHTRVIPMFTNTNDVYSYVNNAPACDSPKYQRFHQRITTLWGNFSTL